MGGIAIFILFLAAILGLSALNGTVETMFKQASSDMFGDKNNKGFLIWVAAIIVIAAAMRMVDLPQVGKAFLVLLIIVFLLSHGGILNQLENDIASINAPTKAGS